MYNLCCSDDEDDTAELLAELQRIKKERAQEEAKKVRFSLLTLIKGTGSISTLVFYYSHACILSSFLVTCSFPFLGECVCTILNYQLGGRQLRLQIKKPFLCYSTECKETGLSTFPLRQLETIEH